MGLAGYVCYKKGAVNATTAGAQTLYQLKLIVGESSGAAGCDVHCENHCLDFPNDIRFTRANGETKHDYWVDEITGTTPNRKATVWIEVTSIPASGSVDFYMYYRKASDSGESSGDNTFVFFDDFEDITSNHFLTNWTKDPNNPILTTADLDQGYWPAAAYDPNQGAAGPWFIIIQKDAPANNNIELFTGSSANSLSEHASSPISLATGTWDTGHREPHTLLWDDTNNNWRLYYCGKRTGQGVGDYKIGVATSTDFINWTPNANNPIVGAIGGKGPADPVVLKYNAKYYMAVCLYPQPGYLHWLVSDNGITGWTDLGIDGGVPEDCGCFGYITMAHGVIGMDPNKLNGNNAGILTRFTSNPGTMDQVDYSENPVIHGVSGTWENNLRGHHDFVATKDHTSKISGLYYYYYCAQDSSNNWQMGLATSSTITVEGTTRPLGPEWTKYGGPTIELSTVQKRSGDASLHLHDSQTPSAYVSKTASGSKRIVTWLYDNSADNTSLQILRLYDGATVRAGVGVYTDTSTSHYIYQDPGYHAASVVRTTGWHKLEAIADGSTWDLFIDGTQVATNVGTTTGFDQFRFNTSFDWGLESHGYYDDVFVSKFISPEPTWGSWGNEIGDIITLIAGVVGASSSVAGNLGITWKLSGAVSGASSVSGALGLQKPVSGVIAASTSVAGTLQRTQSLVSSIDTSSTFAGTLFRECRVVGAVTATSSVTGSVMAGGIRGSINVASCVEGGGGLLLENGDNLLLETGDELLWELGIGIEVAWSLKGEIPAISTIVGSLGLKRPFSGVVAASSTVSGTLSRQIPLGGVIGSAEILLESGEYLFLETGYNLLLEEKGDIESRVTGTLFITRQLAGCINPAGNLLLESGDDLLTETGDNLSFSTYQTEVTGELGFVAATRGFYYAKLGTDNLHNPPKVSFSITTELNNIASFDYEIQNDAHNRDIIANNLTDDFSIMRDDGTELLRASIDSDSIEYYTEGEGRGRGRIRLSGFANFVDLKYLIYKRMAAGDAENVGSVQDEDKSTSTFTDYTTAANNATINDVILTFGAVNDALYIGKDETFFAAKIKYSTKGIQAPNTTVVMEYSKGSGIWATLDCIDESYSFTEDAGTYLLYIPNKADDWAKDTVNGKNQYHIRFRLTQGFYSTLPKLDQIKLSNADVCRVQFNNTPADTILTYLLEGTGYTEDATDQCPSTAITIRGEYDSKLRWIFGLGSALTWEDANGDMQRYDCWIDTAKKVHYKQRRGTDQGDISANFRALRNKMGYEEMGTRIFGTGGQEGINQKKAVVEDLTAQNTHKLREIVLEDNRITTYEAVKEEALKSLTNRKNPLKDVTGDLDTKYWLDRTMDVGDKILVHQPDWNLNNQELYVMRAVIGPSATKLDLGNSQIHLEHLRSTLQRQMDIGNIWMHGSISTYVIGPEEENFERENDTTVHPVRMTIEVPSDARGINHVEISWTLSNFLSSVKGSEDLPAHDHTIADSGNEGAHDHTIGASVAGGAHDHTIGASVAGGAHDHTIGVTVSGGAHDHSTNNTGGHDHTIGTGGVHTHTVSGTIALTLYTAAAIIDMSMASAGAHSHTNPNTANAGYHVHANPNTGSGGAHTHSNPTTGVGGVHSHDFGATTSSDDGTGVHSHTVDNGVENGGSHSHSVGSTGSDGTHTHSVGGTSTDGLHYHSQADTGSAGAHEHTLTPTYGDFVYNITGVADLWTTSQHAGHPHSESAELGHEHTVTIEVAHAHSNPNTNSKPAHQHSNPNSDTKPAHQHTNPNSSTKPAHRHTVPNTSAAPGGVVTLQYGMYNAASGDALELLINDEKVGDFVGSQTGINITGWVTRGNNSVKLQPKVSDNVKGRASISAIATVFLENLK